MKKTFCRWLGIVLPILAAGCGTFDSERGNELRIGVIMPLSGEFASAGEAVIQGMELFREKYAALNPEVKIVLVVKDNGGSPEKSPEAFETLVTREKVSAVIGGYTSNDTFPLKPAALRHRIPVIAPCATNDELTARNPYMFRSGFNDSFQGRALVKYVWEHVGVKKPGVLWCLDVDGGDYARGLARTVMTEFERRSGEPVYKAGYRSDQNDFIAQLKEFRQAGVDAVFAPLYPQAILRLLRDAAAEADSMLIFGSDSWSVDGLAEKMGASGDGCLYSCMFSRQYQHQMTVDFVNTAREKGFEPGFLMAQGYDTLGILVSVMKPGDSGSDIAAALRKVKDYPGVSGLISIDQNGDAVRNVFIEKIIWDRFNQRALKALEYTINPN